MDNTDQPTPTVGKANRGNRRTGQGTARTPWRADPLILERIDLVTTLWAQGYTAQQMLPMVNRLMQRRGVPEVTVDTIYEDRARIKDLVAERNTDALAAHVESLQLLKREAWKAFHTAGAASLNRSGYLNTIRAAERDLAQLTGSLTRKVEVTGKDGAPLVEVHVFQPTPEEIAIAMRTLSEVLPRTVVDAIPVERLTAPPAAVLPRIAGPNGNNGNGALDHPDPDLEVYDG